MAELLPLFPLNSLLVPEGTLVLQIFEPRYLKLMKRCLKENATFGVVPIRDGEEVGQPAMIYQIGVTAEITEWKLTEEGHYNIKIVGRKKFRVTQTTIKDDLLMLASVEYLNDEKPEKIPSTYADLIDLYESLRKHPQVQTLNMPHAEDSRQLGWFLTSLLPLSRPDQISLIALDDPIQRLKALDNLL